MHAMSYRERGRCERKSLVVKGGVRDGGYHVTVRLTVRIATRPS